MKIKSLKKDILFYLIFELFLGIFVGAYGFLLGPYIMSIGYKENLVGTISLVQTTSFALFAYFAGILSTKFKTKTLFVLSSLLCFFSSLLFAFYVKIITIILATIIYALGLSIVVVIKTPFIVKNTKGFNTVKIISIVLAYCITTNLIGNYLAGYISSILEYRKVWFIFGLFSLLSALPALLIKSDKTNISKVEYRKIQITPRMIFLILYTSLGSFAFGLIGSYYTTFLINKLNLNAKNASFINSFNIIGTILAMFISPYISKRIGKTKTLWYTKVLCFPTLCGLSFISLISKLSIPLLSLLYFLRALFLNIPIPIENDLILKSVSLENQAKFNSLVVLTNNITISLSSLMAGFIISEMPNGYEISFILSSIFFLMQGFMFYKFSSNFIKKNKNDGLYF